jgi:enamine deaminase RidA (YjgF/YER057c/UK114 family)
MERKFISSGSEFEEKVGYSRAVVDGDWIFMSGTTGFDYEKMTISEDVLIQAEKCIENIKSALNEAGSGLEEIVRLMYILPVVEDFEKCWPVLRKHFGHIKPASTMFSARLADPRMKIEIEVTAKKRNS